MTTFDPYTLPYLTSRQVALVTGANNGLGYNLTLHLYMHGWTVYMGCRNQQKAEAAKKDIEKEAENRREKLPDNAVFGELVLLEIDMMRLSSVEEAATKFLSVESNLDLLVNNAAVMGVPADLSEDGFDIQLQTNYLSPFLLTQRLIPLLEKSENGPRIVFVSSAGHMFHGLDDRDSLSKNFDKFPNAYWTWIRYGNSKLAAIHAAKVLAVKHPKILTMSCHPGISLDTGLVSWWRDLPLMGTVNSIASKLINYTPIGVTPEQLCLSPLKAGLYPSFTTEKDNGRYLTTYGEEPRFMISAAKDEKKAQDSYDWAVNALKSKGYEV